MTSPFLTLVIAFVAAGLALWLFWPERGLFWRWRRTRQVTGRVLIEDALKHLHDCEYQGRTPTVQSIAGVLRCSVDESAALLAEMQAHHLVQLQEGRLSLTSPGRDYALHVIRAHRLWEHYLAEKTGYAEADWHSRSERREHELSRAETEALAIELGNPLYDPHGDPIPTPSGELIATSHLALPSLPLNQPARIVHVEDEPGTVYAQLIAEGLHPGMRVTIGEITPERVRFWAEGSEHILAPIVAANISVVPLPAVEQETWEAFEVLSQLKLGETARVISISGNCRGGERRRFMDLGILPGTHIQAELISPSGDPTAYRVRGTLIGLRKEQASMIGIAREEKPGPSGQKRAMEAVL